MKIKKIYIFFGGGGGRWGGRGVWLGGGVRVDQGGCDVNEELKCLGKFTKKKIGGGGGGGGVRGWM